MRVLPKKHKDLILSKITANLGMVSWETIRSYVRGKAEYDGGIYYYELVIDNKTVLYYTSNELHFCTFGVRIKKIGSWKEYGLFREDFKKSRNKRLCLDSLKTMDVLKMV